MADDTMLRARKVCERLQLKALELSHPDRDPNMADVMSALALVLEALEEIERQQSYLAARLDHQS